MLSFTSEWNQENHPYCLIYNILILSCAMIRLFHTCYESARLFTYLLTHWGWMTHICVCKLSIISSNNGLQSSPGRRQGIIWTNAGILFTGLLRRNLSKILLKIHIFSFKNMHLKTSSRNWQLFCFGLNVLNDPFKRHCQLSIYHASRYTTRSHKDQDNISHLFYF